MPPHRPTQEFKQTLYTQVRVLFKLDPDHGTMGIIHGAERREGAADVAEVDVQRRLRLQAARGMFDGHVAASAGSGWFRV